MASCGSRGRIGSNRRRRLGLLGVLRQRMIFVRRKAKLSYRSIMACSGMKYLKSVLPALFVAPRDLDSRTGALV
jgi:hypothetical protein